MAGAIVAFFIFMLAGIAIMLVSAEWWHERSAKLRQQIDEALSNPLPPGFLRRR